jgi:hypothetical protein
MGRGRSLPALVLSDADRAMLLGWSRRRKTAQALALRSRIILRGASGLTATGLASELGICVQTVSSSGAGIATPLPTACWMSLAPASQAS